MFYTNVLRGSLSLGEPIVLRSFGGMAENSGGGSSPSPCPRCSVPLDPSGLPRHVCHGEQALNTGRGLLSVVNRDSPQKSVSQESTVQDSHALRDQPVLQHPPQDHTEFDGQYQYSHDSDEFCGSHDQAKISCLSVPIGNPPVASGHQHPQTSQESKQQERQPSRSGTSHKTIKGDGGTVSKEGALQSQSCSTTSLPGNIPGTSQNLPPSTASSLGDRDHLAFSKTENEGASLFSSSIPSTIPEGGNKGTEKDSATVKQGGSEVDEAKQLTRKRLRDHTPSQEHSVRTQFTSMDEALLSPAKEAKRLKHSLADSPDKSRSLSDLPSVLSGTSPIPRSCSDTTVNVTALVEEGNKSEGEFSPIPRVPDDRQLAKSDQILSPSETDSNQTRSKPSESSSQSGKNGTDPHQPFQPKSKSGGSNGEAGNKKHEQKTGNTTAHSSQREYEGKTDTNEVCLHRVPATFRIK